MTEAKSFLQEINDAILQGSPEGRARALWHATDLLIAGRYTEDQIWIFGEVIGRLADEIEVAARAKLANTTGSRRQCADQRRQETCL